MGCWEPIAVSLTGPSGPPHITPCEKTSRFVTDISIFFLEVTTRRSRICLPGSLPAAWTLSLVPCSSTSDNHANLQRLCAFVGIDLESQRGHDHATWNPEKTACGRSRWQRQGEGPVCFVIDGRIAIPGRAFHEARAGRSHVPAGRPCPGSVGAAVAGRGAGQGREARVPIWDPSIAMRQILVEFARKRVTTKYDGDQKRIPMLGDAIECSLSDSLDRPGRDEHHEDGSGE